MSRQAKATGGWYPDPRAAGDNIHLHDALNTINDRVYALEGGGSAAEEVPRGTTSKVPQKSTQVPNTVSALGTSLGPSQPPGTSTAQGMPGQITFDNLYMYVCIAQNTWRRVAHSSF